MLPNWTQCSIHVSRAADFREVSLFDLSTESWMNPKYIVKPFKNEYSLILSKFS